MNGEAYTHQPVLMQEIIEALALKPDGIYIDATFGRGGHSRAILERLGAQGRLYAIDKDPAAAEFAERQFGQDARFVLLQDSFSKLSELANQQQITGKVDGILLDLGVSSPQLDDAQRGFSFLRDGPLDMRMDTRTGYTAAQWLAHAKEHDIAKVLREYGEERHAKRIARAIVNERVVTPIETTGQLAAIVSAANPAWEKHKHPATRAFQAIRIFINQELNELQVTLNQALEALAIGGRLAVVSFHSLEDRIVKRFIRHHARAENIPVDLPVIASMIRSRLLGLGRGIKPTAAEIEENSRSRSAILRVAEKLL